MRTPQRVLKIDQLDAKLNPVRDAFREVPRSTSWIREVRQALGMSTYALAARVGVKQPSVVQSEQSEKRGIISLGTLARYGNALDCDLRYALVPRRSLHDTLEERIRTVARRMVEQTAHSMDLEKQRPSDQALEKQVARLADDLRRELPRWLWDEP